MVKMPQVKKVQQARIDSLYQSDSNTNVKASWENPEIKELYDDFLGNPLSERSEEFLHTTYEDQSELLGPMKHVTPQTNPMSKQYKPPATTEKK